MEPQERVREMTNAEEQAMFEALRSDFRPVARFLRLTGIRENEACSLRWRDVDLDEGHMAIHSKGDVVSRPRCQLRRSTSCAARSVSIKELARTTGERRRGGPDQRQHIRDGVVARQGEGGEEATKRQGPSRPRSPPRRGNSHGQSDRQSAARPEDARAQAHHHVGALRACQ